MKRLLTTLCFCHWSGLAAAQAVLGGANIPTQPQRPPAQSIGNESNWYIDWTSGNVFGPKTSGQWPQTPLATFNPGPGIYNLTGIIYGNGTSAATAIAPGSGVGAALGQPVTGSGGIVLSSSLCGLLPNGTFYQTPFCYGAVGNGTANDTSALQAAWTALQTAQAAGQANGVLDLKGGTFAINAAITATGNPYNLMIQNGSIIPYSTYTGNLVDFSAATTLTNINFNNVAINGYGQANTCLKLGAKTQGVWITNGTIYDCTAYEIQDISTAAGTELKIFNSVIQCSNTSTAGTGIVANGYDWYVENNVIRNCAVGVRGTASGGNAGAVLNNHIYAYGTNICAAVWLNNSSQSQILGNYIDNCYVYLVGGTRVQVNNNKFLLNVTPGSITLVNSGTVLPFSGIYIYPVSTNQGIFDFVAIGNNFDNESGSGSYKPLQVDTAGGTIGTSVNTSFMRDNGFSGFAAQSTEPWVHAVAQGGTTDPYIDFTNYIPFGAPQFIKSYVLDAGGTVTGASITGNDAFINTSTNYNGNLSIEVTVNTGGAP